MTFADLFSRCSGAAGSLSLGRLAASAAAAALLAASVLPAFAQTLIPMDIVPTDATVESDQMLLEADQLVYDFDGETITANGNVKIYYGATVLDADAVTYQQKSGRLIASGGVRILEPSGNVITAERVDITDDFRDGFVESLNVVTTDRARFAAQSAERRDNNLLILRKGVYTACEACREHPDRPPLWQIKAARIIHDQAERTIYYKDARLEFFGVPIAYVPVFFHPDPTVTRKSGFLFPSFLGTDAIGYGITTPYFVNLAPNYDVTFTPTYLSRQGLLMQSEWRHRVSNGTYSVRLSGIRQLDKEAFVEDGEERSGFRDFRGSLRTTGSFAINPRWGFGWDIHATSDRTFNRDYRIFEATAQDLTSTAYLTGLGERSYFDARGYHFRVQREDTVEDLVDDGDPATDDRFVHDDQAEQAVVLPVVDHNYLFGEPFFGGELRLDSNLQSLSRSRSDERHPPPPNDPFFAGVAGNYTRASTRASWKRRLVGPAGQLITPFSYLQGDANWVFSGNTEAGLSTEELIGRAMPAVGAEYEWPFLATLGSTVHTFGPKAQLIVRPEEQSAGDLPNEDSQSLVFDDTSLFLLDKFSGYDRQEGGTRANVGLVYQGLFPNGASVDALVGQSYQLAGFNSFAVRDHALTGLGSGLETDRSDYVSRVTLNTGTGLALTARGRFDEEDYTLNRGEINATANYGRSLASVGYATIRESPASGIFEDREEVNGAASIALSDTWSALGSIIYDLDNGSRVSHSLGLAYADECFEISAVYSETPDRYSDLVTDRQVFVRVNLRTLGSQSATLQ